MKKILIVLCLSALAVSCGSKGNKVNSESNVSGSEGLDAGAIVSFIGDYDILRKETQDCSNSIRIVAECNGVKILSNGFNPAEEFCNVNQGAIRSPAGIEIGDRNPPNPDRNPPNPDNNGETKIVTLQGNVLKMEHRLSPRVAFSNQLTMHDNGVLVKETNLKSRTSRCIYQKRI